MNDVANTKVNKVAAAKLAVDGEIEQRELPNALVKLKVNAVAQMSFSFRGAFWPTSFPLFHGVFRVAT